ncbi:hypothetical protein J2777_003138 [Paraburkholderia graminis]|uniref:DUF6471 domain-containing protein n=1 Tax=Paraburkholderia graminis TaxID=60548 RepID=UPI002865449F|nr:DUF6471 domain-containing protein [Paraburkholderia graminis]MDR6469410.1 hypothetical protein [Paraburkholderia graminis]
MLLVYHRSYTTENTRERIATPEKQTLEQGRGGTMEGLHTRSRLQAQPYGQWEEEAKGLIEEGMEGRKIGYKQLSRMLEKLGIYESPDQINRKINRKRFSAAFLIACLRAMDVKTVKLHSFMQGQKSEG